LISVGVRHNFENSDQLASKQTIPTRKTQEETKYSSLYAKRALSPNRNELGGNSDDTRPKVNAGDASLLMGFID
jgi:hypothetical protein